MTLAECYIGQRVIYRGAGHYGPAPGHGVITDLSPDFQTGGITTSLSMSVKWDHGLGPIKYRLRPETSFLQDLSAEPSGLDIMLDFVP